MPSYPQLLHEQFIAVNQRPMQLGKPPIEPREPLAPVVPMERWQLGDNALHKVYRFRLPAHRDEFVVSLLQYEQETQHNARLTVDEGEVAVRVQTRTAERVTELDREYARFADNCYKDIVSRPSTVTSSARDDDTADGD